MKKLIYAPLALIFITASACSDDKEVISTLLPASDVTTERVAENQVRVTWTDNSEGEDGYKVYARRADNSVVTQVATVGADATQCTITDALEEGYKYYLGVAAFQGDETTRVVYGSIFNMESYAGRPHATVSSVKGGTNCITVQYTLVNVPTTSEFGLCWSSEETAPTIANSQYMAGPERSADGSVFQVIPNAVLDYNAIYYVRAYVKTTDGVNYTDAAKASITTDPAAIKLNWTKRTDLGLPSGIELYETTDKLNGDNFHAWYAIADVSGDIELRVNVPSSATTVDAQASSFNGDCYVLINGGYFYNGRNTGVAVLNGTASGSVSDVRGSLKTADSEYNELYAVTRGIFGVDASGKPAVKWIGNNAAGNEYYYFDCPMPSVKGENKYGKPSATFPVAASSWTPKYAQSAGPVLLKDGKVPFDFTTTSKGSDYYLSNYEIMPYDIFGPDVTPDRTAVGYTSDNKVILFICDGRITASGGATLTELAQVMKGLGCVGAVNFDGGGSTAMVANGQHLNDMTAENRPVVSTIGFFKKK